MPISRSPLSAGRLLAGFAGAAVIGVLGGLIGLGGAEYRLPLLIGTFRFPALQAVIVNKALSLVVVGSALPFRAHSVPWEMVAFHWRLVLTLLAGSVPGGWLGASLATRITPRTFHRVIAILLAFIALVLLPNYNHTPSQPAVVGGLAQTVLGVAAGFGIGTIAALLGVAGGELLVPTFILLFGVDIKLAGSLSLIVSLPTMIASFTRYSRDRSFVVLAQNRSFVLAMAAGSILGSLVGARLLGIVPTSVLLPVLAVVLIVSAVKVWYAETP